VIEALQQNDSQDSYKQEKVRGHFLFQEEFLSMRLDSICAGNIHQTTNEPRSTACEQNSLDRLFNYTLDFEVRTIRPMTVMTNIVSLVVDRSILNMMHC
jgi:hypothetical protein